MQENLYSIYRCVFIWCVFIYIGRKFQEKCYPCRSARQRCQGKKSCGQGCQPDRSTLKPSSLASVKVHDWKIAVRQGVEGRSPDVFGVDVSLLRFCATQDYLEKSLEDTKQRLTGLAKGHYEPLRAYITFDSEQAQRDCLKSVETGLD